MVIAQAASAQTALLAFESQSSRTVVRCGCLVKCTPCYHRASWQ